MVLLFLQELVLERAMNLFVNTVSDLSVYHVALNVIINHMYI